jgi:hypothetical protein
VLFLDWPCDMMNVYHNFTLDEKKDFWRIYGAECYASGLYFSFHLGNVMPGEPSAQEAGILDFLKEYSEFYREYSSIYHDNTNIEMPIRLSVPNITGIARKSTAEETIYVHMINHNYSNRLEIQKNITVSIPLENKPSAITLVSPDFDDAVSPVFSYENGTVTITVDSLDSYNVLKIK